MAPKRKISPNSWNPAGTTDITDRLSSLPSLLIERILGCLPLQDVVRMSILSRQWRYQWALFPQLKLDKEFFDVLLKPLAATMPTTTQNDLLSTSYSNIVNNVLLMHNGPIHKFFLYIPPWFPASTDIIQWIQSVCSKGVKDFTLIDERGPEKKCIPSNLFSCVGLKRLSFVHCNFRSIPLTFSGFSCLTNLVIPASMEPNALETLISSCPRLGFLALTVDDYDKDRHITIRAAKLLFLYVIGYPISICLNGTTNIYSLYLDFGWQFKKEPSNLFCSLSNVNKLILVDKFWKCWHKKDAPPKLGNVFKRLTTLKLDGIPVNCHRAISFPLSFLARSPHLQMLEIKNPTRCKPCGDMLLDIEEDCSLYSLQKVKLLSICGSSHELQLIKLLLARSPTLQVMTVELNKEMVGAEEKLNVARELMWYPRASTNAKILFQG